MDVNLDDPIKTGFYDKNAFAEFLCALHFGASIWPPNLKLKSASIFILVTASLLK